MIALYCTDRGQHRRAVLFHLDVTNEPHRIQVIAEGTGRRSTEATLPMDSLDGSWSVRPGMPEERVSLPCRHCRRRPVWTAARARAIYDGAEAAGMSAIDLSYLD